MGEANIPAESAQTFQEARIPASHVDPGRPGDPPGPSAQGTSPPVRLIGRIGDRATFEALAIRGRRARSGSVTVTFVAGTVPHRRRVAYSIGRRVGGSVDRNRLRRRLRAIIDELASGMGPGDYLVSAGAGARQAGYRELKAMASNALRDLGGDRPPPRPPDVTPAEPPA